MRFGDKLSKIVGDGNRSELARRAGLSSTAITDYLQKGYIPRADKAVLLARALDVPLDWLVDDERDWPPPKVDKPTAANLSDDDLMMELARRYRHLGLRCLSALEGLEKANWELGAVAIVEHPLDAPLPWELQKLTNYVILLSQMLYMAETEYDVRIYANLQHASLPGSDRKPEDLNLSTIMDRYRAWALLRPHFGIVARYVDLRSESNAHPARHEELEAARIRFVEQLKQSGAKDRAEEAFAKWQEGKGVDKAVAADASRSAARGRLEQAAQQLTSKAGAAALRKTLKDARTGGGKSRPKK